MPCDQLNPASAFLERYSTASTAKLQAKEAEEQRRRERQAKRAAKQQRQQQQQSQSPQRQMYDSEEDDDDDDDEEDEDEEEEDGVLSGEGMTRSHRSDGTVDMSLEAIAERAETVLEALRLHQPGEKIKQHTDTITLTLSTHPCQRIISTHLLLHAHHFVINSPFFSVYPMNSDRAIDHGHSIIIGISLKKHHNHGCQMTTSEVLNVCTSLLAK